MIEFRDFDPSGSIQRRVVRLYDNNGNQTEEITYGSGGAILYRQEFVRNEKGEHQRILNYMGGKLQTRMDFSRDEATHTGEVKHYRRKGIIFKRWAYTGKRIGKSNDQGKMTEEVFYDLDGSAKWNRSWDYDDVGNWIKNTNSREDPEHGWVEHITTRTIEYFDDPKDNLE